MSETQLDDLIATLERFRTLLPAVAEAGAEIQRAIRGGNKVLTAGNGGSAADALHLAEEFVGRFEKERPSLPAVALCADPTLLTCIGNDYGFDRIFSRQVEGLGRPGDVLVVFSTSGKSPNLVTALRTARARGLRTIAVLGKDGGDARGLADHELIVPSKTTARIQEVHTFILHSWLAQLEETI
jgi:D-sedoheptulose 7-phosphate isomerase